MVKRVRARVQAGTGQGEGAEGRDHVQVQAQQCQSGTASRAVVVNGHPKYQVGWHQSVLLDERW